MAVRLDYLENNTIGLVTLEDKENKNTFSKDIISGLDNIFKEIAIHPMLKVIVITGYDNYFCCGGTKEELLQLTENKINFNSLKFFRYLLDCELPTISAMQGHALGGGLVFGLYADIIFMAEESFYAANFMQYGFTPGMGATYILPKKLGFSLGTEMLFSAQNYQGHELMTRGISHKILKKSDVLKEAVNKAKILAEKPLVSLKLLKKQLAEPLRNKLIDTIQAELKMHEVAFKLPEVREKIERL